MQLDSEDRPQAVNVARFDEKAVSDLRERFIAPCASRSKNPDRSRHRAAFALRPWALATTAVQPDRQCADRWCKRRAGGGFGVAQRRIAASRGCQWPRAHRTGESVAARWRPGSGPVHLHGDRQGPRRQDGSDVVRRDRHGLRNALADRRRRPRMACGPVLLVTRFVDEPSDLSCGHLQPQVMALVHRA